MRLQETLEKEWERQQSDFAKNKLNLVVIGGTGVGKSSLVNSVFSKKLAVVGNGKPVTKGLKKFETDEIPVCIYDTEGYEISQSGQTDSNFYLEVLPKLKELQEKELKDQVHCVWYCIAVSNHRITDFDFKLIKEMKSLSVPVLIVFTKCDTEEEDENGEGVTSKEFRKVLEAERTTKNIPIYEVSNDPNLKLQLGELVESTADNISDENLRNAFVASQKVSLKLKNKQAKNIVHTYTATTATSAAANPLPFSDSLIIVPQQLAMAAQINSIYGFELLDGAAQSLLKSQIISLVGKQLAASLTKFIPIIGQIVNGAVAGAMTASLGHSLIFIYEKAYMDFLENGLVPNWAHLFSNDAFQKVFQQFFEKESSK